MKFKKGEIVKIIAKKHGHEFNIGTKVKITELGKYDDYDAQSLDGHNSWYIKDDEIESIE